MPSKTKPSKIYWSIDAFFTKPQQQKRSIEIIDAWNLDTDYEVKPVFVLNDITDKKSWAHPDLKKGLETITKSAKIKNISEPKILRTAVPPFTNTKLVASLVKYIDTQNCELLVVNSASNRKALARLAFGSFAETLILTATKPILLINTETEKISKIKSILFPTDFSPESKEAYFKVLKKAHGLNAKVILFHRADLGTQHLYQGRLDSFEESKLVKSWTSIGDEVGVPVKLVIKGGLKNKADSIVEQAKRAKVDLIALVSRSGRLASILLGSTTRQLVRRSELPVWILHPKKHSKKANSSEKRKSRSYNLLVR